LSVERDALDREEARAKARQAELETRLAQASRDLAREEEHIAEAEGILRRLGEEKRRLEAASSRDHEEPQLRAAAAKAKAALDTAEETLRAATTALAEARAERGRREGETSELQTRMARLEAQAGEIEAELARRETESGADGKLQALSAGLAELSANVQRLEVELQAAEAEEEAALKAEAETRATAAAAKLASQELETEFATLLKLLAPAHDLSPIVEEIRINSGYEQALGAALGDDLDAASDETAPSHWRLTAHSGDDPELPEGATPLSKFVKGPEALARRLRQIGVVDAARGRKLQTMLAPGQRLVSKQGDLWRWDGYSLKAGTDSAAGARLVERKRLNALKSEAAKAEKRAAEAESAREREAGGAERAKLATKALRRERRSAVNSTARATPSP
jgi:chromosome segregation protein